MAPITTIKRARSLRRAMSLPEGLLWRLLRRRGDDLRFRRQHPLGPYVIDFYCADAKLAFEIDGASHNQGNRPERDEERDAWLATQGLEVVRIGAADVLASPETVADRMLRMAVARVEAS